MGKNTTRNGSNERSHGNTLTVRVDPRQALPMVHDMTSSAASKSPCRRMYTLGDREGAFLEVIHVAPDGNRTFFLG